MFVALARRPTESSAAEEQSLEALFAQSRAAEVEAEDYLVGADSFDAQPPGLPRVEVATKAEVGKMVSFDELCALLPSQKARSRSVPAQQLGALRRVTSRRSGCLQSERTGSERVQIGPADHNLSFMLIYQSPRPSFRRRCHLTIVQVVADPSSPLATTFRGWRALDLKSCALDRPPSVSACLRTVTRTVTRDGTSARIEPV
jgi:hypothetical protein